MHTRVLFLLFGLTVFLTTAQATDPYVRQPALDVQHYAFNIELNDSTDRIAGSANITILFRKSVSSFFLDFGGRTYGEGMKVLGVQCGQQAIPFSHEGERLTITAEAKEGQVLIFTVLFQGIPEEGLVISKNKFGDRTFFADHWPDRGHLWLPCIDHPSDKATVDFSIVAPDRYAVVASGLKQGERALPGHRKLTQYRESVPIAMKVTAMGVARFAVEETTVDNIPQSIWVYPQNRVEGFSDFAVGKKVFQFYHQQIGPYAYEKLAHVQSKTRWGGLENASNIFYSEKSVTGKNGAEHLIAHEAAHQWFGDAVTEDDWHHVWLSEGFANYFANLYWESVYGKAGLREQMVQERKSVLNYNKSNPRPIVDTTITEIGEVLNINTYQKACWVLHMLRQQVGDEAFWRGIRDYYSRYRNKNCLTEDFREVMEKASGQHLGTFFEQWIFRGGHPTLEVTWTNEKAGVHVVVEQVQPGEPFTFPLEIKLKLANGQEVVDTIHMNSTASFQMIRGVGKAVSIVLDPGVKLLFEGSAKPK